MKLFLIKLSLVCSFLLCMLQSVLSQGVLIIEISDTLNTPLSNYPVNIKDSKGVTQTLTTNNEGRIEENNFPIGDYSYSFSYGDYNRGSFIIKSGEYTWVDLDFRRVNVNFKDEKGNPTSGNSVTIYKREADGTRILVGQKTSGDDGNVQFVVPEGEYTYIASDGEHDIVVKDENINTTVTSTSQLITYTTSFRFVKNGKPIAVYAKNVYVSQNQNGNYNDFGIVLAHSNNQANGYVEYAVTDGKISCPIGEYQYRVNTKEYGTITNTFSVTQLSSVANNIVDIEIPDNTRPVFPGGIITPDSSKPTYKLKVLVRDCQLDKPIENIPCKYLIPNEGQSFYKTTNKNGYAEFSVNEGDYSVYVPFVYKEVTVTKDTTVEYCVNIDIPYKFQKTYFQFFYNGKEVFPQTIKEINIQSVEFGVKWDYEILKPTKESTSGLNKFVDPAITVDGEYTYSFEMDEYNTTFFSGDFKTDATKAIDTVKIEFETKINVKVNILYADSTPASGIYGVTFYNKSPKKYRTDKNGHFETIISSGEYTVSALNQDKIVTLTCDTAINFFLPKEETRKVYFKFLHDSKEVYPNITTLNFYPNNSDQQIAFLSSTLYNNYQNLGRTYVFDNPIELPTGEYVANYDLVDFNYEGQMFRRFTLNKFLNDTTIYIVIPAKRTVEIQIKDANGANVQGVFANIYKYVDGEFLDTDLNYDGKSHSQLMSDATGIVLDQLTPGLYQIQILDIVRDFEVTDYNLKFSILSDVKMYNVKFTVLYKDDETPLRNLKLNIKKGRDYYSSGITDYEGSISFLSEAGTYTYTLDYGNGISDNYRVSKDDEFIIYIDRPTLVDSIIITGGETCLAAGQSTKFMALITPSDATYKNVRWTVDNDILAKISSDGTLTANNLGLSGDVTITATTNDRSNKYTSITVNISENECVKDYKLTFGDGSTEMWIEDFTFDLVVSPLVDKPTYYVYQTSQDGANWHLATEITKETTVTINSDNYVDNGTHLFRAVAAEDSLTLVQIINGSKLPDPDNVTNIIYLYNREGEHNIKDKTLVPTVFTPHEKNGANDDFMPGYKVVIYNRFGDVICKSDNGWDGKYKGETADAGVYIYVLTMRDGTEKKGTIQLYRK